MAEYVHVPPVSLGRMLVPTAVPDIEIPDAVSVHDVHFACCFMLHYIQQQPKEMAEIL